MENSLEGEFCFYPSSSEERRGQGNLRGPCPRAGLLSGRRVAQGQTNEEPRPPRLCTLPPLSQSAKRGTSLDEELSAKSREEIWVLEHSSMPRTFLLPIIRFLTNYVPETCPLYINITVIFLVPSGGVSAHLDVSLGPQSAP